MHSIPAPVRIPAAVGAIQWIDGFQAVHANLGIVVSKASCKFAKAKELTRKVQRRTWGLQ
jgi:hypothetical protein